MWSKGANSGAARRRAVFRVLLYLRASNSGSARRDVMMSPLLTEDVTEALPEAIAHSAVLVRESRAWTGCKGR